MPTNFTHSAPEYAIPICDGIGKPHLDAEDPVDALPIFLPTPRRLIVPSRSASPPSRPIKTGLWPFVPRQWPFCMTPHDTFPSEKGYILSFPGLFVRCRKTAVFPRDLPMKNRRWLGRELNPRHEDFQSSALPTELPSHLPMTSAVLLPTTITCRSSVSSQHASVLFGPASFRARPPIFQDEIRSSRAGRGHPTGFSDLAYNAECLLHVPPCPRSGFRPFIRHGQRERASRKIRRQSAGRRTFAGRHSCRLLKPFSQWLPHGRRARDRKQHLHSRSAEHSALLP